MIDKVYGTGGIGTGLIFRLDGNWDLGREESRLGYLTDSRDFCKQHIILHYIAKLARKTEVHAIGKIGLDVWGTYLIDKMQQAGIMTDAIEQTDQAGTMFSICYQYPNETGGNITSSNSACNLVSTYFIEKNSGSIDMNSLVLAAPEVPIESRIRLLEIGRARGAFNVGAVLSGETDAFERQNGYSLCDLLSVNMDEARSISGIDGTVERIAWATYEKIAVFNRKIKLIVTSGKKGAYTFENERCQSVGVMDVAVASTAGAGDALLGGTIAGIINGLPFQKSNDDSRFGQTPLSSAVELGAVASSIAVACKDTIADAVTKEGILMMITKNGFSMSEGFEDGLQA
jgi:sugar/nucleoside kinase (ribokinase family)